MDVCGMGVCDMGERVPLVWCKRDRLPTVCRPVAALGSRHDGHRRITMPTIATEAALLVKPDKPAVDFITVTQEHDPAAQRAFDKNGGPKPAAGATCRTH
jgi:hypothetical protein